MKRRKRMNPNQLRLPLATSPVGRLDAPRRAACATLLRRVLETILQTERTERKGENE